MDRRSFITKSVAGATGVYAGMTPFAEKALARNMAVTVLNPKNRVPVSFIIDDSTALVNMAYFGIPQFAEVFPDQYLQAWKKLPREIPDSFVREFGEWCRDHGVKGKYSMVPYPACTGWLHRFIPGWSKQELKDSLSLVRDFMSVDWDIHPEMISHTRVINLKTGLPFPDPTPEYMENWEWSQDKSADELTSYLAYALNILKEAGFNCEGVTTPGGFGHRNMDNLASATLEACREIYDTEIPHFFRDVRTGKDESVEPELFHVSGLDTGDPKCSVHVIGCTGDWFGGWDGLEPGNADLFINPDLDGGRLVEVIEKGDPAILVCHWPGIYYNGTQLGFNVFKTVVGRLHQKYDHLVWMKLSEIARYWACKKLTTMKLIGKTLDIQAPFSTPDFTIRINKPVRRAVFENDGKQVVMEKINQGASLSTGKFFIEEKASILCFDLPKGASRILIS
ncbi:MAG: hypothetical protein KFF73_15760 [Cyclobacteriaceae bacterium]|nr:hypothetical protein [Cyclobacteriaceae bacterium]